MSDNAVTITQKISIATPTPFLDSSMQLYRGEVQNDGTINWIDPKPMPENPQLAALQNGKRIFQDNCASCHAIERDLTGPALGGVLERLLPRYNGNIRGLYQFTRFPPYQLGAVPYYRNLLKKFGAVMTMFPVLSDTELNNIYAYIENETKWKYAIPDVAPITTCEDSCILYRQTVAALNETITELGTDSIAWDDAEDKAGVFEYGNTSSISFDDSGTIIPNRPKDTIAWSAVQRVIPTYNTTFYYQFNVESFGWHNVDCMVVNKDNVKESELTVHIGEEYKYQFEIYLVIPSAKVLMEGALLKDKNDEYGFYMNNGSIPLPQHTKAYIIAMGEVDKQVIFGKVEFTTQEKQTFELQLTKLTREACEQQIAALKLNDAFKIEEIKYAETLENASKNMKEAEKLMPKGCKCNLSGIIPAK